MPPRPILLLLACCCAAHAQFAPAPLPAPLRDYPDAERMRFGYVTVPVKHANPGGPTLQLAVVILPALGTVRDPDPVFYIVGGPGGSATLSSGGFPIFTELNRTRDIVYADPRGAGFSQPNLFLRRDANTIGRFADVNRAFFAQRGIDLTAFNTTEIAQDYNDVRVALGYGQINLFASSYGTFVAQEMIRRGPSNLRAIVMSGNDPATDPFLPTVVPNEKEGIEALLRDVASNGPARNAFPNFRTRFYRMMARVTDTPIKLRLPNRDTGRIEAVTIDGREFVSTIIEMLQRTETIRYIPLLVQQLDRKNYGSLVRRFFAPRLEPRRENPFGMYLSVLASDFAAPGYARATERGILSVRNRALIEAEGPIIYQLALIVEAWRVPYNPGTTRTLPQAAVPTLLLNGRMDAQTPASGGGVIAAGLSNSTNYIYPRIGHAVGFDRGPDLNAAVSFIRNPGRAPGVRDRTPEAPQFLRHPREQRPHPRPRPLARPAHRPAAPRPARAQRVAMRKSRRNGKITRPSRRGS